MGVTINATTAFEYDNDRTRVEAVSSDFCSELKFTIFLKTFPVTDKDRHYGINNCFGELFLVSTNEKIGDLKCHFPPRPISKVYMQEQVSMKLTCIIDLYKFKKIEEKRKGDIRFNFKIQFYMYEIFQDGKYFIDEGILNADYSIPRSIWVEEIIPKLNFGKYELFEIPISDNIFIDEFKNLVIVFEKSKKFFISGDYDESVSQCRKIIEHIPKVFPLDFEKGKNASQKEIVKEFVKIYILPKLKSESKTSFIEDRFTQLWNLTSIPHHKAETYFNRYDAEIILYDTTSILSYVGKILKT